jgi:hypothetical protein
MDVFGKRWHGGGSNSWVSSGEPLRQVQLSGIYPLSVGVQAK